MGRARAAVAAIAAVLVVVGLAAAPPVSAATEPITAGATLEKTASATTVGPGETFTYGIQVGCSSITDTGCKDAVLTDAVPAPFVVVSAVVGPGANTAADPTIVGSTVTVNWSTDLGDGRIGLLDGTTAIVTITARLPADASHDVDGIAVLNNASMDGANFAIVQDQVPVTPLIPFDPATTASKTLSPDQALAAPGAPLTATIAGTNTSNGSVETLTLTDPIDPAASPNPFELLPFVSFGTVTPPAGTTSTAYRVFVAGAWVNAPGGVLPGGVDAADVRGTEVTFAGTIPAGATGTVVLNLEQSDDLVGQAPGFTVVNTVESEVAADGESASAEAEDAFAPQQDIVQVAASKTFDDPYVVAGESTAVTLGARNTTPAPALDSMTIREPSSGAFAPALEFEGFDAPIVWPAGATGATVTYTVLGVPLAPIPFGSNTIPPPPIPGNALVQSFEITFTGAIAPGAETAVSFGVGTDADADPATLPLAVPNEVAVEGARGATTADDAATDTLYLYDEQVQTYVGKQIRPGQILASPGEVVTVSLTGGTTERPVPPSTEGTTANAEQIVIQDPQDPVDGNVWWNAFDATAITQTPIPAGTTLSVEYWSVTQQAWVPLPGAQDIAGPQIWSFPIPAGLRDDIGGLRFVYEDPAGFAPGTDLSPNFTSSLRGEGRYTPGPPFSQGASTFVPNCAQSSASITAGDPADSTTAQPQNECPVIEIIPADPGDADLIDKEYGTSTSGGLKSVIARSGDRIPSVLNWSTGGFSNLQRVEITDVSAPATTPIAQSVYDGFDLTRVEPITPATDPLIAFDQVTQVLLYNGAAWVAASADPCPAACVGTFPGVTLTAAEQASTLGVRIVFAESPQRAAASVGNLDAPPVGSGVARSFANERPLTLTWRVRDVRRSDGEAALGSIEYNLGGQDGVARNTVNATGFPATGPVLSADDQDDVVIIDVPITTSTDKNWSGGPVAVPPADSGLPPQSYPLTRMTVTTRNTTPARVDQLQITDPGPGSATDPFDVFQFGGFVRIATPSGASAADTRIDLFFEDGSAVTYTQAQALALTAGNLPSGRGEVIGFQARFEGRIAAGAAGVVELDLRLRPTHRVGGAPVTVGDTPILNTAQGVVADVDPPGACPPPASVPGAPLPRYACDDATASMALSEPTFGLDVSKSFSPAQQKEPDDAPIVMTLTGQPTGSARPVTMALVDQDPKFWNAFDFVGMDPGWFLTGPIARVQACYAFGATFTDVNGQIVVGAPTGGDCSPSGGTLAEAIAFMNAAPADVHAVQFQFWSANGLGWSNPSNPRQSVPILVQRRENLRSGGPVPTTRSDQIAAPGQPAAGIFDNTMEGIAISADITPGNPLQANSSSDAQYRYLHLQNSISVTKTPNGDVRPGVPIPFTMSFTNNGERPITDPVFTDELPMDAQGSQLILYPDRDPSISPYRFALTGPATDPATGLTLPVDPALLTIDQQPDRFVFTPPAGSVLAVGQTYTITVELMLRPGLTRADTVTNTALITGAEPFDDCVTSPAGVPTTECRDDATVRPLAVPALSTVKYVRAAAPHGEPGIPEVISDANGFDCSTAATVDGFYRAPCLPVTLPGGTEQWRFTVTNAGTLPIDRVVTMDHLPIPGDQGLIVVLPRDSAWTPQYIANTVQLVATASTPVGAVLTPFYSSSENPCTADLNPLLSACPAGAWQPLTSAVAPGAVRSLKFVVDFPGELFEPGDVITMQFDTTTIPAPALGSARWPTAWNTVAAGGATANTGQGRIVVPATEGRRVGVTYPTGPIQLEKIVSGDAAEFAPDSFPVQLACTNAGVPMTGLPPLTLVPGAPAQTVSPLPFGAECTATEGQYGQTTTVIGSDTVGGPTETIGLVSVENVFDVASLSIHKTVDAAGLDQRGDPVAYGPFDFTVRCTFLGNEVWADGYSSAAPMDQTLTAQETWALADLPVGSDCTVTEVDDLGATGTSFIVTEGGTAGTPVAGDSVDVTIVQDATVDVEAVNEFGAGSLELTKLTDGPGADDFGQGPFQFAIDCVLDTGSGETRVWAGFVTLAPDETVVIPDIAAGASCTIIETVNGGATSVEIEPNPVTIQDGAPVEVEATNIFDAGSLTITKAFEGDGVDRWGAGPFEVTLECDLPGGGPVQIPGGATRPLDSGNGYSATYELLLVDLLCTITETDTGGATSSTITDAGGDPVEGTFSIGAENLEFTVTNTFDVGSFTVTKTVSGGAASAHAGDAFTILAQCEWDGAEIEVPGGAERTITANAAVAYEDLPVGAECGVREVESGGASAVTLTPVDPADPSRALVTIGADVAASVTIDNRFDPPLPATGADGVRAAMLAGIAALLVGLGVLLVRRRRRV